MENKIKPDWVSRFTDGEGSFGVYIYENPMKKRTKIILSFSLSQHEVDLALLKRLNEYLKVGYLYKDTDRPVWVYKVSGIKALYEVILPFFSQ